MERKSSISLKGYSKKYRKVLFDDVDLYLKGKFVGLFGENGCGKSTIMRDLYCKYKNNVSYIEQNFKLFENATGKENIQMIDKNIDYDLLKKLNIEKIYHKKINEMSLGERQRIICYIAVKINNEYIFLDEIDNHLDYDNAKKIYTILKRKDCNLFVISHNKLFLEDLCDQKIYIDNNKLISMVKQENISSVNYHKKRISLVKMFLKKCHYLLFLFINILLMLISIAFSNINVDDINAEYFSNVLNLQVEPIIYKNNVEIKANYLTLKYLESFNNSFKETYINLVEEFIKSSGNKTFQKGYLSCVYEDKLEYNYTNKELEIYVSEYYLNNNVDLVFPYTKIIKDNTYQFNINFTIEAKIIGYLDIPRDCFVYDYNQFVNYINSNFFVEKLGYIDFIKSNSLLFDLYFDVGFVAVLSDYLPYEEIGEYLEKDDLRMYLYSANLLNYKNAYQNFYINNIIYKTICYISITIMFALNIYFIEFFLTKKKKIFKSFYNIYGLNLSDILMIIILLIILFLMTIFSLVIVIN